MTILLYQHRNSTNKSGNDQLTIPIAIAMVPTTIVTREAITMAITLPICYGMMLGRMSKNRFISPSS